MSDYTVIWDGRGPLPGCRSEGWQQRQTPATPDFEREFQRRAILACQQCGNRIKTRSRTLCKKCKGNVHRKAA